MIVANMSLREVYDSLTDEKRKLEWKCEALLRKAVKEIRQKGVYPAWVMYDYKVPLSNNQYVVYFYSEQPYAGVMGGFLCVVYDNYQRYMIKWTEGDIPEIHVLTSHFLQRYKERFLEDPGLSANEVAVRYFTRNHQMHPIQIDERINKHVALHGEYAGEGFLVPDGFCFKLSGEERYDDGKIIRISLFTTFMRTSDMSDSQREAIFDECMKDVDNLKF